MDGLPIFLHLYNKKVLKYGEQDVKFVNLVWVIVEVPLVFMFRFLNELIDDFWDLFAYVVKTGYNNILYPFMGKWDISFHKKWYISK